MDNEYNRLLNLNTLPDLFECKSGYLDEEDCSWYHHNWMILRLLGLVSNPFWHETFYYETIKKYANPEGKTLVLGTADFSMPYLCQRAGLKDIEICDICKSPLNICKNVSDYHSFNWKTKEQDIFDGIKSQYDLIINDAFITRFSDDKKRKVFESIYNGLVDGGFYITAFRHGSSNGGPIHASTEAKQVFISKAIQSATQKNLDAQSIIPIASQYIERIVSYPIQDEAMLNSLISDLFVIEQISTEKVPGECASTEYFHVVLRKISHKATS